MKYFGGVEGGASSSRCVLIDERGKILATVEGDTLNHLLIGQEETFCRILHLITQAKREAKIAETTRLTALGLSMSGCEQQSANQRLEKEFMKRYDHVTQHVVVCSDIIGSLKTAMPGGGVALIAGTGSNSILLNADDSSARCGGWGHLLGDEAGGYWIAQRGIKMAINDMDNFHKPNCSTDTIRRLIFEHFGIDDYFALLPFFYTNFNKKMVASLCGKLAEAADSGDELCRELFRCAGAELAEHVVALLPQAQPSLLDPALQILCVGSVFNSWKHMKAGFNGVLLAHCKSYVLYKLKVSAAVGAAYFAATSAGIKIPADFEANRIVLDNSCTPSDVSTTVTTTI